MIHVDPATGRVTVFPIPTRRLNIWDRPFAVYALTSLPGGSLGVIFRNPRASSQIVPTLYRWSPGRNYWQLWGGAASSQSQLWPDAVAINLGGQVWFSDTPAAGSVTEGIPGHTTGAILRGLGSWEVLFQPTNVQRPAYAFVPALAQSGGYLWAIATDSTDFQKVWWLKFRLTARTPASNRR